MRELLKKGADVNLCDSAWDTPLITAAEKGDAASISALLRANAKINRYNKAGFNAIEMNLTSANSFHHTVLLLLYAAGEKFTNEDDYYIIPDALQHKDEQMQLIFICRQAIRKHLINLNPYLSLFGRVPLLGLPRSVASFLLFDQSLDWF